MNPCTGASIRTVMLPEALVRTERDVCVSSAEKFPRFLPIETSTIVGYIQHTALKPLRLLNTSTSDTMKCPYPSPNASQISLAACMDRRYQSVLLCTLSLTSDLSVPRFPR